MIVGRVMGAGVRPYENEYGLLLRAYLDEIVGLPGFDRPDAVKNGRVYIITNDHAVTPNYPSALVLLAKWFYPETFGHGPDRGPQRVPGDDGARPGDG